MKYRFIDTHRGTHRVEKMARLLGVSRGGYYAWKKRPESARRRQEKDLLERIRETQRRVKYRYGSPRMTRELARGGFSVGHNRVARLMAKHNLGAKPRKKHRVTTDSKHGLAVAENLLARQFAVSGPDQAWVSDLTYLPTGEGWLYLAVVIDLYARKVVGWALSTSLASELVIRAFQMACLNRQPPKGLLFHLRSGCAVRQPGVSGETRRLGRAAKHEPQGGSLGQRLRGDVLQESEDRADREPHLPHSGGGENGGLRVHRDLLQPDQAAFSA